MMPERKSQTVELLRIARVRENNDKSRLVSIEDWAKTKSRQGLEIKDQLRDIRLTISKSFIDHEDKEKHIAISVSTSKFELSESRLGWRFLIAKDLVKARKAINIGLTKYRKKK